MSCIFCNIVRGNVPTEKVYEDESVLAFKDLNPQAPIHLLIIPKSHISSVNEISEENSMIVSRIFEAIPKIAEQFGIKDGYRIVNNCGESAGQTVMHMHFHILGGRTMQWPPG